MSLALSLGLNIVAEGVETREPEAFLTRRSCHIGQGFVYSKPLAASDFESFYHSWTVEPLRATMH